MPRAAAPDLKRNSFEPDAHAQLTECSWQSNPKPSVLGGVRVFLLISCYIIKALLLSWAGCCPNVTVGGAAPMLQQLSKTLLLSHCLILPLASLCSLALITLAAVWILSSTCRMTVLRSDFTRSSAVQTHSIRQHSLNKQGKDGKKSSFNRWRIEALKFSDLLQVTQGCTGHRKRRLPESLFAA